MVPPRNATRREAERHNADAQSLREILPDKEVFARADKAAMQPACIHCARWDEHLLAAVRAPELAGVGR